MKLPKIDPGHVAVALGVIGVGLLAFGAVRKAGGLPIPPSPTTEALIAVTDQRAIPYLIRPEIERNTLRYTKHRYPSRCGGELTTAIHYGHSRLAVPDSQDSNWITSPPSEVTI